MEYNLLKKKDIGTYKKKKIDVIILKVSQTKNNKSKWFREETLCFKLRRETHRIWWSLEKLKALGIQWYVFISFSIG